MRGDFLGVEGWGVGCGEMGVEGEPARDGVAGEREPAAGGKDGVGRFAAAFAKPRVESVGGGFCQWRDAVLAAFAVAGDVRGGAEVRVGAGESGELGDS